MTIQPGEFDMTPKLAGQLAQDLGLPLATLLMRSACGDVAGTVGKGLLQIVERLAGDYLEQRELARHFQRIGERIVQKLQPVFRKPSIRAAWTRPRSPRDWALC